MKPLAATTLRAVCLVAGLVAVAASPGHAAPAQNDQVTGMLLLGLLVLLALSLPVSALTMLYSALAPSVTGRASGQLGTRRRAAFWIGLLVLGSGFVAMSGFQSLGGAFLLINLVLLMVLTLSWLAGFSGVAHWVGRAILEGKAVSTPVATGIGALTLSLCSCMPFVGWVIGFYVACLSVGISVFTRFSSNPAPEDSSWSSLRADDVDIVPSR